MDVDSRASDLLWCLPSRLLVSCAEKPEEGNAQRLIDGYLGLEWGTTRDFIEGTLPWYVSSRYGFTEMENFSGPGDRGLEYQLEVLFAGDQPASRAWQGLEKTVTFIFLESQVAGIRWDDGQGSDSEDSQHSVVWGLACVLVDSETDSFTDVREFIRQLKRFYGAEPVQSPPESESWKAFERGERMYSWFDSDANTLIVEDDFRDGHVRLRFYSQKYLRWLDELEWQRSGDSEYPCNHVADVLLTGMYNLEFGMERSEAVQALSSAIKGANPRYESAGETTPGVYTVLYPAIVDSLPLLDDTGGESLQGEVALDFLGTGLAEMELRMSVTEATSELFDALTHEYESLLGSEPPKRSSYRRPSDWSPEKEIDEILSGERDSRSDGQSGTRNGGYELDFVMITWRDRKGNEACLGLQSLLRDEKEITFTVTSEEYQRLQARLRPDIIQWDSTGEGQE